MALKFSIQKESLLEALSDLQNFTNKKTTMAILTNVLVMAEDSRLVLKGTDLEIGLKITLEAQIEEEGSITLPSKKLFEIVRESSSETIDMEGIENDWVVITSGKSRYNLAGITSDEFPEFPEYDEDSFNSFDSYIFPEIIDKVIFSIANEQKNKFALTSVLFEKHKVEETSYIKMISSDEHRLSIMERDVAFDVDELNLNELTLIPKKGIQEFKKFCENRDVIELSFEEKQMITRDEDSVMFIRLKKGEFPQYQAIVDTVALEEVIIVNRLIFLESLKRMNLFTDDEFNTIQLQIENGKMILSSLGTDFGDAKDELEIEYSGNPLVLGINCRYLIDTLQVMEGENIEAYINSSNSPFLIKSMDDQGFISIIMPMQLDKKN